MKWAEGGALEGDAKDAPPPREWAANGWTTKPDLVLKGVSYNVPAQASNEVIEWMTLVTSTGFTRPSSFT